MLTDILHANGALTYGGFIVDDDSTDYDFTAAVSGTSINLTVVEQATLSDIITGAYGRSGVGATSTLLYLLKHAPGGDLSTALTLFRALQTNLEKANAVQQMLPVMTAGMSEVNKGARFGTNRVVQARQDANKGLSSTAATVWMIALNSTCKQILA